MELKLKKELGGGGSTWEAEAGGSLSLRPASDYRANSRTVRVPKLDLVSKAK